MQSLHTGWEIDNALISFLDGVLHMNEQGQVSPSPELWQENVAGEERALHLVNVAFEEAKNGMSTEKGYIMHDIF